MMSGIQAPTYTLLRHLRQYLCVIMTKYNFIKYENMTKNNSTYFNSTTSTNTNTTGQKANTIIPAFGVF